MKPILRIILAVVILLSVLATTVFILFSPDLPSQEQILQDAKEHAQTMTLKVGDQEVLGLYSAGPQTDDPFQERYGVRFFDVNGDSLDLDFYYRRKTSGEWILEKVE